mmetsp:Transcript_11916/g.25827  ORF Transcript_11916/g.25827 Transcript_11916/m.25827 type:complete len:143 (-) Transcript_11916:299-727(-)
MPRKNAKPDPQRQLMIKVKACQRLVKEAAYYETETKENEAKLQRMKDEKKDPYDVKKFQEVLGESQMMIPDSISRRDRALEDLREYVGVLRKEEGGNAELMGCEWMTEAEKMIGEEDGGGAKEEAECIAVTAVDGLAEGEAF